MISNEKENTKCSGNKWKNNEKEKLAANTYACHIFRASSREKFMPQPADYSQQPPAAASQKCCEF